MSEEKSRTFEVKPIYAGWRLDRFLVKVLPRLSRTRAQKIIESVTLSSGRAARPNRILWQGEMVTLHQEVTSANRESYTGELPVLYEDDDLFVIDKPAPLACHPSARYVSGTVVDRTGFRLVHRLDRETSGVLLLAKNEKAERWYQDAFRDRSAKKRYLAWVAGAPTKEKGTIDAPLRLAPNAKARLRVEVHPEGQPALTCFEVIQQREGRSLVALYPETGRQHQLRVHLASIGHPIIGDKLYQMGEDFFVRYCDGLLSEEELSALPCGRLLLHAESLQAPMPGGRVLSVSAPLPKEML